MVIFHFVTFFCRPRKFGFERNMLLNIAEIKQYSKDESKGRVKSKKTYQTLPNPFIYIHDCGRGCELYSSEKRLVFRRKSGRRDFFSFEK